MCDDDSFFQLFRDTNPQLYGISSYALKTAVMHMLKDNPSLDWNKKHMGQRWLEAVELLRNFLKKGSIPFYFDFQANLLHSFGPNDNTISRANWLDKQVEKLRGSKDGENCRDVWIAYF